MRICVVAGFAPSLVNFRAPLLKALLERGHEVIALAPAEGGGAASVEAALRAMGIRLLRFPMNRGGTSPRQDLRTLLALRDHFRTLRPGLVLPYTIKPVIYGSLAARWAKVPHTASLITGLGYAFGNPLPGSPRTLGRRMLMELVARLYAKALETNHVVFFQNPDDEALFARMHITAPGQRTVVVAGSGVDLAHYAPAPPVAAHEATGGPIFLCIARLLWAKGVGVFVEACRMLKRKHPHAVCRLLGPLDTVPDAVPLETVQRWREDRVVEILDPVDDVRPHLAGASVFVLPSYREGTPRSVLEAMSMGRPVITTDVPGCRHTVEDGVTGLLVPPFEPGALARAMERFLEEPELIAQMGAAGRRLAEEKFGVERVVADMLAALPLESPPAPAARPGAAR